MLVLRPRMTSLLLLFVFALRADAADVLEKRLMLLAGYAPVDCGSVEVGQDATSASACAKRALEGKEAFIVRYYLQGIDSTVAVGLAGTKYGQVFVVEYDSMGWNSEGMSRHSQLLDGKHNVVKHCPAPVRLTETSSHRLTCFIPDPKAKGSIMSPNLESY